MKQTMRNKWSDLHAKLSFAMCGVLMLTTAASCTDETESMGQASPLTMNITVDGNGSRAIIEDGALPNGGLVGVTIVDATGSTYNGTSYVNIKGTTSGTSLSLASEVMMTDTDATIYAYYPWASGVTETAVPLTSGDTDYLYATPITGVNSGNANATLSMSHALACLRLNINRGAYAGTGALTTLTVTSDALSSTGKLNARTGAVTATGTGVYETDLSRTISDATITEDIMVIPTETAADITISLLVDGNQYYVTAGNVTLTKGSICEYTVDIET